MNLKSRKVDFYCLSYFPIGKLLGTMVVFDFEFVSFKNIFSLKKSEVFEFLSKKNHCTPKKKIISFGLGLNYINSSSLADIIREYDFNVINYVLSEYL